MLAPADRPALSLADLEAHDPYAADRPTERRFLCPLPACANHQRAGRHRSLAMNAESGLWICHRCRAAGKVRERWEPRRERARATLRRAFGITPAAPAEPPNIDVAALYAVTEPLIGSPAGRYLAGRGIPQELAKRAGARYAADFYGRPAVAFPLRDRLGGLVAVVGRYIDGRDDPKGRAAGKKSLGVFTTPGALEAPGLVITEAPCDALALALCGVPAVALCGTSWPEWIAAAAAFKPTALALDADDAGDRAADELGPILASFGAKVRRWRPIGAKDWNELLARDGVPALDAILPGRVHGCTICAGPSSETSPLFCIEAKAAGA